MATDRARHQCIDRAPAILPAKRAAQVMLSAAEIVAFVELRNRVVDVFVKSMRASRIDVWIFFAAAEACGPAAS